MISLNSPMMAESAKYEGDLCPVIRKEFNHKVHRQVPFMKQQFANPMRCMNL